jgi:membrane-bound lytic murein transglycosylase D
MMRYLILILALFLPVCPLSAAAFTGSPADGAGTYSLCIEVGSVKAGLSLTGQTQVCTEVNNLGKKAPPVLTDYLNEGVSDEANDVLVTIADKSLDDEKPLYQLIDYSNDTSAKRAVKEQVTLFTERLRGKFSLWLTRSKDYFPSLKQIFIDKGMPEDLVYLSLIESGFNFNALSRASAAGPWQFMEGTARKYGLKVNYWVDERRNPFKATHAASSYLKDLHERFGAWELALAAYNAGEGNVEKAIHGAKTNNFWEITKTRFLPRETKDFVPRFIAASQIGLEPLKYGFDEQPNGLSVGDLAASYDTVTVTPPSSIAFIAEAASTTEQRIIELNPELKRWCLPPNVRQYTLNIPAGTKDDFQAAYNAAPAEKRTRLESYVVRKKDTLSTIAKRYRISPLVLVDLNKTDKAKALTEGSIVYLPPKSYRTDIAANEKSDSVKHMAKSSHKHGKVRAMASGSSHKHGKGVKTASGSSHKQYKVRKLASKRHHSKIVAD